MQSLRNKVTLIGRLGQDPEVKVLDSGKKLAKFSLATSETYKSSKGEKTESTEWHNIVVWDNLAGIVEQYTKKGSQIALEGKLTSRSYEKEGVKHNYTEIVCNDLVLLDSASKNGK